jgi:rhomboid protease GluP
VQLLFGMLFGSNFTWIADLAAFFAGFGISFFVAPGGLRRILAAIRRD